MATVIIHVQKGLNQKGIETITGETISVQEVLDAVQRANYNNEHGKPVGRAILSNRDLRQQSVQQALQDLCKKLLNRGHISPNNNMGHENAASTTVKYDDDNIHFDVVVRGGSVKFSK